MNVDIIEKPKKNISEDIKVGSSTDIVNLKDVQEIRNAIREHLLFIGLDNRNNIRNITLLGIGTSCNVVIDSKEIIRTALYSASNKVILVHNHPSNNLEPSKDDLHLTDVTNEILKVFNIQLQDHIIVTEKDFISMNKIQKIGKERNIKSINTLQKGMLIEENERLKQKINELQKEIGKNNSLQVISAEYVGNYNDTTVYNVELSLNGKKEYATLEKKYNDIDASYKWEVFSNLALKDEEKFSIQDATNLVKNIKNMQVNNESIRARIYEGVEKGIFTKISRGVYKVTSQIEGKENTCLLINGDGRDLSIIKDKSIDGIITDHPYDLQKALTGGNRKFATFELFRYESKDFKEKQRVLKEGAFLVEFLPEESEVNFDYLYEIKKMAQENGFKYFAKVAWKKGNFISNTGRKSKNIEDVMIFSNGEPRSLKLDAKKNLAIANENNLDIKGKSSYEVRDMLQENNLDVYYMKGTNGMLPTAFDYQPKNIKDKVMEAEKPVELIEEIIEYISKPYETLLDQYAGSGNFVIACYNKKRNGIAIEKNNEMFEKMKDNIESNLDVKFQEIDYEY